MGQNLDVLICFPQILTRRIRFRLERAPGEGTLIDRTGKCLKMEPLTTIADLERYLLKMVAKQWYDFERHTFNFVKQLKEPVTSLTFTHQSDFDENGLIYWIGTNAKWVLPNIEASVVNGHNVRMCGKLIIRELINDTNNEYFV